MGCQFVKTRHGELAVHVDDQPGEPLIMLHGLGGDHLQVQAFLPEPRLADGIVMRRIAPDMRGHGDTTMTGDHSVLNIRAFAEDVHDVIFSLGQTVGVPPATVLGISMGAAVTLELACRWPDLVTKIILIRPSWDGVSRSDSASVFPVLSRFLRESGPAGLDAFTQTAEYRAVAEVSPPMAASLRKQFARQNAQERAAVLEYIPSSFPMRTLPEISAITVPALVLGAPGDPVHPLPFAETLASAMPNARFTRLPRKLESPGEHEAELRTAVSGFLRDTQHE